LKRKSIDWSNSADWRNAGWRQRNAEKQSNDS